MDGKPFPPKAVKYNFKYKTVNFKSKILHDILKQRGKHPSPTPLTAKQAGSKM